jgi:hypothetical protein
VKNHPWLGIMAIDESMAHIDQKEVLYSHKNILFVLNVYVGHHQGHLTLDLFVLLNVSAM